MRTPECENVWPQIPPMAKCIVHGRDGLRYQSDWQSMNQGWICTVCATEKEEWEKSGSRLDFKDWQGFYK